MQRGVFFRPGLTTLLFEELTVIVVILTVFRWTPFKSAICEVRVVVVH